MATRSWRRPATDERLAIVRSQEIGNKKYDGAARDDFVQIIQRCGEICSPPFGLEIEHLADQPQCVQASLLRRNEQLDILGEEQKSDFVAVVDSAKCEDGRDLRSQLRAC